MYHHSPVYSGYRNQAPAYSSYAPTAISPQLLVTTNISDPIVPGSYSPEEEIPESPRAGRNISGCLCCRVRHKRCGQDQDQYGRCSTCRNLNIECMKGYHQEYPPGLKVGQEKQRAMPGSYSGLDQACRAPCGTAPPTTDAFLSRIICFAIAPFALSSCRRGSYGLDDCRSLLLSIINHE
ncbi:hypothetical protein DL93DRAFT_578970 [Clavulina sp. PMI_390]|nr:hypothetical protein DL93DRAFT_578970 [Clavulina sp. PMI_390]